MTRTEAIDHIETLATIGARQIRQIDRLRRQLAKQGMTMHYTAERLAQMKGQFVAQFILACDKRVPFPSQRDIEAYFDRGMSVKAAVERHIREEAGEFSY